MDQQRSSFNRLVNYSFSSENSLQQELNQDNQNSQQQQNQHVEQLIDIIDENSQGVQNEIQIQSYEEEKKEDDDPQINFQVEGAKTILKLDTGLTQVKNDLTSVKNDITSVKNDLTLVKNEMESIGTNLNDSLILMQNNLIKKFQEIIVNKIEDKSKDMIIPTKKVSHFSKIKKYFLEYFVKHQGFSKRD